MQEKFYLFLTSNTLLGRALRTIAELLFAYLVVIIAGISFSFKGFIVFTTMMLLITAALSYVKDNITEPLPIYTNEENNERCMKEAD